MQQLSISLWVHLNPFRANTCIQFYLKFSQETAMELKNFKEKVTEF